MTNTPADVVEVVARAISQIDIAHVGNLNKAECSQFATAALTAYHKHLAENGMVIVPMDPSEAMLDAGADQLFGAANDDWHIDAANIYRAMIEEAGQ